MRKRLFAYICAFTLLAGALPGAAALEGEAVRAADTLVTLGLLESSASGDYDLDAPATRAQAAVLLVGLAGAKQAAQSDSWISGFVDLPAGAGREITYAAHQGWVSGVSQTEFRPNSPVTANAWFTFLLRMLGYSDKSGDFTVDGAAVFAQHIGLAARAYTGTMTRGGMFRSAVDALAFSYKEGGDTVAARLAERTPAARAAVNALGLLETALTARQVADRLTAALFCMEMYETQRRIDNGTPSSNSSGFFITSDGLAITNYHSIQDGIYGVVILSTGESYEIERVVYYDEAIDIAVIRVSQISLDGKTTSAFPYLELVGVEDVQPGDAVYSLGNPLGQGLSVSQGIISATEREVDGYELPLVVNTADISQGSSGGALMNIYGQVIAVTTGAYTRGNSMYLGVPVDPAMKADWTAEGMTLPEMVKAEAAKAAAE